MRSMVANLSCAFERDLIDRDPPDQFAHMIRCFMICHIAYKTLIDITPTRKKRNEFIAYIRGNALIGLRRSMGL